MKYILSSRGILKLKQCNKILRNALICHCYKNLGNTVLFKKKLKKRNRKYIFSNKPLVIVSENIY